MSWGELFPKNHRIRVSWIRSIILSLTKNKLSWELALVYVAGHKIERNGSSPWAVQKLDKP